MYDGKKLPRMGDPDFPNLSEEDKKKVWGVWNELLQITKGGKKVGKVIITGTACEGSSELFKKLWEDEQK